ncbi:MAG: molybdopterin oxidoreductase, partial [Acidobacteriota bacterium]
NRGGRWWAYNQAWTAAGQTNAKYGRLVNMYLEKAATLRNSLTGEVLRPLAGHVPIADSLGRPIVDAGYDLQLITSRTMLMCKSRTISNYWLLDRKPFNEIEIHPQDASRLGFRHGQRVKVTCATNTEGVWDLRNGTKIPMVGVLKVTEKIRPGVINFVLGYGHWAYGSDDQIVDGVTIRGDRRRSAGVHANAAMRLDDHLRNTTLSDVIGGSAVFYDTKVRLVPA